MGDEIESLAWQGIGGLGYTLGELHKRGDLTDYGIERMRAHLDHIRAYMQVNPTTGGPTV